MLKNKVALFHFLIWMILLAVLFLTNARGQNYEAAIIIFVYGGFNIAVFYTHYFLVNPLFIGNNKYWRAIGYSFIILTVSIFIKYATALYFEDIILKYGDNHDKMFTAWQYFVSATLVSLFFMLLSSSVYIISSNFKMRQDRNSLENEKLNAELAFLKSQINPHFLFNSLNNIYSLAYKKSERTPEAILKLAEIMRYMLYESNEQTVSIEDEINYLKNYIELQKLRIKDEIYIDMRVDVEEKGHRIMPLILISFLENAFKHGASTDINRPIRILIEVTNGRLHFKTENVKSHAVNKDETKGVGLTNLRRRLELGYPDRHSINITASENYYISELFIYL